MKSLERRLYEAGRADAPRPEAVERAAEAAIREFYASQSRREISYFDFLLTQARTVQKRWWLIQAALLAALWCLLSLPGSARDVRTLTGAVAPLLAVAALPELWKNVSSRSTEVESASYFGLRGIYSARLTLFAVVDLCLLSVFCALALGSRRMVLAALIYELLLPFTVSCCICFSLLCSSRLRSEALAVALCMVYTALWSGVVMRRELYERVSAAVWAVLLLLAAAWLGYCLRRLIKSSENWSEPVWN